MWWLIGIAVVLVVLVIWGNIQNKKSLNTRFVCDVCEKRAGTTNNRRFTLKDGFACESCIKEAQYDTSANNPLICSSKSISQIKTEIGIVRDFGAEVLIEQRKKEQAEIQAEKEAAKAAKEQKRKNDYEEYLDEKRRKAAEPVKCPKCGSTQISADKKGYSVGKAAVGKVLIGNVGLAAGAHGSDKVVITCLKCGNQWKAGKAK